MTDRRSPSEALHDAVAIAGSQAAMARLLGVAQPSVWRWLNKNKPLPGEHVLTVERETGVPKEILRPDLYQSESSARTDTMEPAR